MLIFDELKNILYIMIMLNHAGRQRLRAITTVSMNNRLWMHRFTAITGLNKMYLFCSPPDVRAVTICLYFRMGAALIEGFCFVSKIFTICSSYHVTPPLRGGVEIFFLQGVHRRISGG